MNIKNSLLILGVFAVLSSCNSKSPEKTTSSSNPNLHKVLVEDVLQTTNYTYLHVKENNAENWLAVPAMQAKSGETYYYQGGMTMNNFESKELKRSFETVIFLEKVSADPTLLDKPAAPAMATTAENSATPATANPTPADTAGYTRPAPVIEKKEVKVQPAKGGITIADLFAKKESFAGKTVKITGQVTKYTPGVMGKNWIHIQDGTESNKKFDLAVTSSEETKIGDKVTLEGKISLNKDLGYGYFFDVLMEDATIKQ
jgi:hypothetical protein